MKVSITLLTTGAIALIGNIYLIPKMLRLWPMIVSMFFASVKVYTVFSLFIHQLFS